MKEDLSSRPSKDMLDETKLMEPRGAFPQTESQRAPQPEPPEVVSDGILFGPDGMPMAGSLSKKD